MADLAPIKINSHKANTNDMKKPDILSGFFVFGAR